MFICRPALEKCLFKFFTYFLIGFLSSSYSVISPFIWYDLQIFSPIPWFVFFTLLMAAFKAQKVILKKMHNISVEEMVTSGCTGRMFILISHQLFFLLAIIFYHHDHQMLKEKKVVCCVYLLRTYMEVFYLFFTLLYQI